MEKTKEEIKQESPGAVLEEGGVGFDPYTQGMDLSKDEKRRTTAIALAIGGYKQLIIQDAEYLREVHNRADSGKGPAPAPASIKAIAQAAMIFDYFIEHGKHMDEWMVFFQPWVFGWLFATMKTSLPNMQSFKPRKNSLTECSRQKIR